jgi:sugar phosphate isomerase/epimerase
MHRISRRRFLSMAALLAAHRGLPAWATASSKFSAGIQLFMVSDDLTKDPAGTLRAIASMGYREIESAGLVGLAPADFRKIVQDAGLRHPSAHLYFGLQDTSKLLEDAHALGLKYVVSSILPPRPPASMDWPGFVQLLNGLKLDDFKKMAAMANQIGKQAKEAGFQYAYHNHNFEFRSFDGTTGYDVLLHETDPRYVKFEADCGWMVVAGANPADLLKRYAGRFCMIHVKDFLPATGTSTVLGPGEAQEPTELGRGRIDYKPIFAAAKKFGVEHCFVEQEPPFEGVTRLEAAKVNFDYVSKLL